MSSTALARILALPRRRPCDEALVRELSACLTEPGCSAHLRPAQAVALRELYCERGLFAPMRVGAGKTLVSLLAAPMLGARRPLLVVRGEDRDKTIADFARYRSAGWRVQLPRLATYSLLGHPRHADDLPEMRPDLIIMDEAHHSPAQTFWAVVESCRPEARLWGFTATPWHDTDEARNEAVQSAFQEFFTIDRDEVKEGGHLVDGVVKVVDLDQPMEYEAEIEPLVSKELRRRCALWPWQDPVEHKRRAIWMITSRHLQENVKRNAAIVNLARSEMAAGETVIVLVGSIEHGEFLCEAIEGSAILHSKLPKKLRKQRVDDLRSGALRCAIATSLMDEGADFPRASVLILAAAGRSSTKTIQRVGRVMRPHAGKTQGVVYDFADRGLIFAHAQHKARMRVYRELNYTLEK